MRYLVLFLIAFSVVGCASSPSKTNVYNNPHAYPCPNQLAAVCYSTTVAPRGHWYQNEFLSFRIPKKFIAALHQGQLVLQEYYVPLTTATAASGPVLTPLVLNVTKVVRLENVSDQQLNIINLHLLTPYQPRQDLQGLLKKMQERPKRYFSNAATRDVKVLSSGYFHKIATVYLLLDVKLYNGNAGYLLYSLSRKRLDRRFILSVEQKVYSEDKISLQNIVDNKFVTIKNLIASVWLS